MKALKIRLSTEEEEIIIKHENIFESKAEFIRHAIRQYAQKNSQTEELLENSRKTLAIQEKILEITKQLLETKDTEELDDFKENKKDESEIEDIILEKEKIDESEMEELPYN